MLTPELLARAAVSEPDWYTDGPEPEINFDLLRAHIADAIRAAVAAQRERDAQIVEQVIRQVYLSDRGMNAADIAAAIRAQS